MPAACETKTGSPEDVQKDLVDQHSCNLLDLALNVTANVETEISLMEQRQGMATKRMLFATNQLRGTRHLFLIKQK